MIYTNFLYFIIAIILFSTAPLARGNLVSLPGSLIGLLLVILFFWQFNQVRFNRLKLQVEGESVDISRSKRELSHLVNLHTVMAIVLFALELFVFNLKAVLSRIPLIGGSETVLNTLGLSFFLIHLSMVWYWSFRSAGSLITTSRTAKSYIGANIKFNLVIVIPWLIMSLILDALYVVKIPLIHHLLDSAAGQVVFVGLLLVLIAIFAPVLITRLWDCRPLPDSELKTGIMDFCQKQGVRFRQVMSWNALNRGLVTAGVVGLVRPFRYLLITPGLIGLLTEDEMMAVVSHEVGHVRKRHLLLYFIFFIGFMVLVFGLLDRLLNLFMNTGFGFNLLVSGQGEANLAILSLLRIFFSLFIFILYFRFIFGYFMRNFEREADLYCFQSGIDPGHLISSFMKLGAGMADGGRQANWHHFSIAERIGFIRKAQEKPALIQQHKKKLRRSLGLFLAGLLIFSVGSFNPVASRVDSALLTGIVEKLVAKDPGNARYHSYLAMLYYEQEKWEPARDELEASLLLDPRQPDTLNNLAWLYLKCPDSRFLDEKKALERALQAYELKRTAYILDTLAEAYWSNSRFKEAFLAARQALALARENRAYYEKQLKKMKQAFEKFGNSIST
jgi:Zn-dependent protease with chaperone function